MRQADGRTPKRKVEPVHAQGTARAVASGVPRDPCVIAVAPEPQAVCDGRWQGELRELRAALERIEDPLTLLAGIFAFAPFGLQIYDRSGRSLLTNRTFREMFGSEPPQEYNVLDDEIARAAGVLDLIRRAFAGDMVHVPAMWYDPRELTQVSVETGQRVAIESTFLPLLDEDGRVRHVAIVFKDRTEELRLREDAQRERDFLHRLIGVLGHDLRTPLTAVIAGVSLLLRGQRDPERTREGLLRVKQSAGRMNRMIANIVELTRIRVRGECPLLRRPADLAAISRTLIDELLTVYPDREIALEVSGDATAYVDANRIAQVVSNLLTNALAYGRADAPIAVQVAERSQSIAISVRNEGPAIPAEQLSTIFKPFERGVTGVYSGSTGLGLGLYIANEVALAHGGLISVASSECSTTFELELPRTPTEACVASPVAELRIA